MSDRNFDRLMTGAVWFFGILTLMALATVVGLIVCAVCAVTA